MREIMDKKKIVLVNLSKGRIGESNANLLGSMLITKMYLAALSRADASKLEMAQLPNFYVYVDEFQSFANDSFADILSEARKYKLNLTIAHQYIEQMTDEVRAAVFGNVGTMISFRVGSYDAEVLEKEFAPVFLAEDIVNLGFAQIYLRLMIDGIGSQPFSATTLPPLQLPENSYEEEILGYSRKHFARPRKEIEEFVKNLHSHSNDSNDSNDGKSNSNQSRDNGGHNNGGGNKNNKSNNGGRNGGNNSGGRNNNSNNNNQKPKTKPVISNDLKNELNKQLEAKKKAQIEAIEKESNNADLEEISLKEMTLNTQSGYTKKDNQKPDNHKSKSPTPEHKNSLKDALAGILGDLQSEHKKVETKSNNQDKTNKNTEKKERDNENNRSEQDPFAVQQNTRSEKTQNFKNVQGNSNFSNESKKNDNENRTNEIPEEELRKILEV